MEKLVRGKLRSENKYKALCGSKGGGDGQPDKGGRDSRVLRSCRAWLQGIPSRFGGVDENVNAKR